MATGNSSSADKVHDAQRDAERAAYREENRVPNIHMFKKPSWYTGVAKAGNSDKIDEVEYQKLDHREVWRSALSLPMLVLLASPILLALALTLLHYGTFPDSMTPYMFKAAVQENGKGPAYLAGFWSLALIAFVPWSSMVSRFEVWLYKFLE